MSKSNEDIYHKNIFYRYFCQVVLAEFWLIFFPHILIFNTIFNICMGFIIIVILDLKKQFICVSNIFLVKNVGRITKSTPLDFGKKHAVYYNTLKKICNSFANMNLKARSSLCSYEG